MNERKEATQEMTQSLERLEKILDQKGDEFYRQAETIGPYQWVEPKSLLNSMGAIAKSLAFHHFAERMILELIDASASEDEERLEKMRKEVAEQFSKHEKGFKWVERLQNHTPDTEKVD